MGSRDTGSKDTGSKDTGSAAPDTLWRSSRGEEPHAQSVHTCNDTHVCAQHPSHVPRHTHRYTREARTRMHRHIHAHTSQPSLTPTCRHSREAANLLLPETVEQPLSSISQPFAARMRTQAPAEQPAAPSRGASDEGAGREHTRSWAWAHPASRLACPGTGTPARRGTIWSADAPKSSKRPKK